MDFPGLYQYLNNTIKELPGEVAQLKMAPQIRFTPDPVHSQVTDAGVLILLFPFENELSTVFMQRNVYPGVHSGQISFPGGKMEKNDKNIIYTALREVKEETGIDISTVKIIGQITPLYIHVSNFNVIPVIGISEITPVFKPDTSEVEKLITVKIKDFFNTKNITDFEYERGDIKINAPCYNINGDIIWGATAMILSEFLEIMKGYYYPA